jgi:hypothetical protein
MFSKRLESDIRTGPVALDECEELMNFVLFGPEAGRILAERLSGKI